MFDFLSKKFSSIFSRFSGKKVLSAEDLDAALTSVSDALLESDVPYDVVKAFIADVKDSAREQQLTGSLNAEEYVTKLVHDQLLSFLGGVENPFSPMLPSVIMVMGLQGSGKTTTIAKLAAHVQRTAKKPRKILVGSVDFYRPAAVDQLQVLAAAVGVDFYRAQSQDPVQAAREMYEQFKAGQYDLFFLDTAGRLHVDTAMLDELRRIDAALKPRYKILVLDAMTGQESLAVAKAFDEGINGFAGAILSKMDSDTRGGAAFSFRYALKKPILFVGVGEKPGDLELFRSERIAQRMLGMGDLMSLVERANEKIKRTEQERFEKSLKKGVFTLEDFASQMDMVSRMGSLSQIMKYLPGAAQLSLDQDILDKGEVELKRFKAIINAMTRKERLVPKILNASRKARIARGAGVSVADVNVLLKRFDESQHMLKSLRGGAMGRFFK